MDWQPTGPAASGSLTRPSPGTFSDDFLSASVALSSLDSHSHIQSTTCTPPESDFDNKVVSYKPHPRRPRHDDQHSPSSAAVDLTLPELQKNELNVQKSASPSQPQRSSSVVHKPASAKRKGPSTRIPAEARQMLEEEFAANPYPCSWEIDIIAHQANLDVKRVRNWYNNTRARKKTSGWSCHHFLQLVD